MTPLEIARVCHEANRGLQALAGEAVSPPWDQAPDWQRASAIAGVEAHLERHRPAGESHELWLAHKQAEGWVYGPVKDEAAKTHPCMVPYDELPEIQRRKDHLFGAIVRALSREI